MQQNPDPKVEKPQVIEATMKDVNALRMEFHTDRMHAVVGEAVAPLREKKDTEGHDVAMTPDELRGSMKFLADLQLLILNDIVDDGAVRHSWSGQFKPGGKYHLVRRKGDNLEIAPESIPLPDTPEQYVRALREFQKNERSWSDVKKELTTRPIKPKSAEAMAVDQFEQDAGSIVDFDDATRIAKRIQTTLSNENLKFKAMGGVSRAVERVLDAKVKACSNLISLKKVSDELGAFLNTDFTRNLIRSRFADYLDAGALVVGKHMIEQTMTEDDLANALGAIGNHPFSFAAAYARPLEESREDALAKIKFLSSINRKKEQGLDALMKEVAAHKFKAADRAEDYRAQIYGFIERRRAIVRYREALTGSVNESETIDK